MTPSERRDFRHTKIVCTMGPATDNDATIEQMAHAGMNIARLNMSHVDHVVHKRMIDRINRVNKLLNHPVSLLLDLQGPEIRTGDIKGDLKLEAGQLFYLCVREDEPPGPDRVFVNYPKLIEDVKPAQRIMLDNGLINLEVVDVQDSRVCCHVLDGGMLGSRKHVNLPGVRVRLPSITEKDREDIAFGIREGTDFIAMSFVRSGSDVHVVRDMLKAVNGTARLISKIENQEGLANFDEILEASDGIMVARGDLGVETHFEELPVAQRRMVQACAHAGKPVIVATHLLESMIKAPMPTRAEVTDVANAVYEEADAIMLSAETATGKYPVRSVQVMDKIARRIEKEPGLNFSRQRIPASSREELVRKACRLCDSLRAPALMVISRSGRLAQLVSVHRPSGAIIYAFTNSDDVRRKLWLLRSVVPFVIRLSDNPEETVLEAFNKLKSHNRALPDDHVIVVTDVATSKGWIPSLQVRSFGSVAH